MSVISKHGAGFFSCCSVKLRDIVNFINAHKKQPINVDSSGMFCLYYKKNMGDVTYVFFSRYDDKKDLLVQHPIRFSHRHQFINYSKLDYNNIIPVVERYFSPSKEITDNTETLRKKYNIDYNNTIGVYYRGTDKYKETSLASYHSFYAKIKSVSDLDKKKKIIIQTDTSQFIDYIKSQTNSNITIISEISSSSFRNGVHFEKTSEENHDDMLSLFSVFLILSKCNSLICTSCNGSLWINLYRNNNINVYQYLRDKWIK